TISLVCHLHSPHHPPALLPFPTRRSSDLGGHRGGVRVPRVGGGELLHGPGDEPERRRTPVATRDATGVVPRVARASSSPAGRPRSEEHTSELQSRGHLVCRLLLEKKKKRY